MQRRYAVLRVDEWRKRFGDSTLNLLRIDGFHPSDGVRTDHGEFIHVETLDAER